MKNKKLVLVAVLLCFVAIGSVFAFGIGVQAGGGFAYRGAGYGLGNVAVTFKLDQLPLVFAVDFGFHNDSFSIGGSGDYWFLNPNIVGPLNWFLGAGLGLGFTIGDIFDMNVAARLPIGLNAFFIDGFLEPYLQIVPQIGLGLTSGGGHTDFGLYGGFAANLGLRLWF